MNITKDAGKWAPGPWELLPLEQGRKYYGTKIRVGLGIIEVWTNNPGAASEREIVNGWEPDCGMDHVETDTDLATARIIAAAPEMADMLLKIVNSDMAMMAEDDGRAVPELTQARDLLTRIKGEQ